MDSCKDCDDVERAQRILNQDSPSAVMDLHDERNSDENDEVKEKLDENNDDRLNDPLKLETLRRNLFPTDDDDEDDDEDDNEDESSNSSSESGYSNSEQNESTNASLMDRRFSDAEIIAFFVQNNEKMKRWLAEYDEIPEKCESEMNELRSHELLNICESEGNERMSKDPHFHNAVLSIAKEVDDLKVRHYRDKIAFLRTVTTIAPELSLGPDVATDMIDTRQPNEVHQKLMEFLLVRTRKRNAIIGRLKNKKKCTCVDLHVISDPTKRARTTDQDDEQQKEERSKEQRRKTPTENEPQITNNEYSREQPKRCAPIDSWDAKTEKAPKKTPHPPEYWNGLKARLWKLQDIPVSTTDIPTMTTDHYNATTRDLTILPKQYRLPFRRQQKCKRKVNTRYMKHPAIPIYTKQYTEQKTKRTNQAPPKLYTLKHEMRYRFCRQQIPRQNNHPDLQRSRTKLTKFRSRRSFVRLRQSAFE